MKIVKKIRLIDGSEHSTKERADRHLTNLIYGERVFNNISLKKNASSVIEFFYENEEDIINVLQLIRELKEVHELKDFYES